MVSVLRLGRVENTESPFGLRPPGGVKKDDAKFRLTMSRLAVYFRRLEPTLSNAKGCLKRKDMNKVTRRVLTACVLMSALASVGFARPQEKSLYDRLGGKAAITAVVDQFVSNVAADNRINSFFKQTAADPARLAAFKGKLVDQICEATGGPCKYTGKDMKTAHAGMGITDADFDALVGDLVAALDQFKVGEKEKGELLGALGPMRKDIVEK
jgi:hemoglobin